MPNRNNPPDHHAGCFSNERIAVLETDHKYAADEIKRISDALAALEKRLEGAITDILRQIEEQKDAHARIAMKAMGWALKLLLIGFLIAVGADKTRDKLIGFWFP